MSSGEVPDRSRFFTRLDMGMVDASPIARDNGIKLPVILTEKLWNEVVQTDEDSRLYGQKEEKRLASLLRTLKMELIKCRAKDLSFTFIACKGSGSTICRLLKSTYREDKSGKLYLVLSVEGEKIS
jgi:hypothetical protein